MNDKADLGLGTLKRQRTDTLVLLPQILVPFHIGFERIQRSHDHGVHAVDGGGFDVSHVPQRRVWRLLWAEPHRQLVERVELSVIGQLVVTETLKQDF